MTIADDDAHLAKLKLPLNKDMQEDPPLTEAEEKHLQEAIVSKLQVLPCPVGRWWPVTR